MHLRWLHRDFIASLATSTPMAVHMVDLSATGPTFKHFATKNLRWQDAYDQLQFESVSTDEEVVEQYKKEVSHRRSFAHAAREHLAAPAPGFEAAQPPPLPCRSLTTCNIFS